MHAPGGRDTDGHHGDRQTQAEGSDRRGSEGELAELEADQQHRDRSRAGDQPARDAEQRDLARGDVATIGRKLAGDLLGVLALVGILVMLGTIMMVPVIVPGEGHLVGVSMVAVRQPQSGREFMWLRDFSGGFEVAIPLDKPEALARAVLALGRDRHVLGSPRVAAHGAQAPAGRHTVLEDRELHDTMASVDGPDLVMVVVIMIIVMIVAMMVMTMMMPPKPAEALARAPQHPG